MDEQWMGCTTPGYRLKMRSLKLGHWEAMVGKRRQSERWEGRV